jgi:hypothetical protein
VAGSGAAGTQGAAGSGGAAGTQGAAGSGGAAGAQGAAGSGGAAGTQGVAGAQGTGGSTFDGGTDAVTDAGSDRAPSCPAAYTSLAEGAPCATASGVSCDYPQGRCECLPCAAASGAVSSLWSCRAWDTGGPGCPAKSPPVGSACSTPNLFCTYGGLCSISVGDDLECVNGAWQKVPSPLGSCVFRMCGAVDAGAPDHPPDTCGAAGSCPGGTCWLGLDGAKTCVKPRAAPTLGSCQGSATACCTQDGDCTQGSGGRCLPRIDVVQNFCGGAFPFGNACLYDQCKTDADCQAAAGAPITTCLPSGALDTFSATCTSGGCRTDADCTLHAGGRCLYDQAATNGVCALRNVLYCAYPTDPCGAANAPTCPSGMICVPNDNYQGRQCGKPPPMYP